MRITFATWLTPEQHQIEGVGISIDEVIPPDPDPAAAAGIADRQLLTAVETLIGGVSEVLDGTPAASASPVSGSPESTPVSR